MVLIIFENIIIHFTDSSVVPYMLDSISMTNDFTGHSEFLTKDEVSGKRIIYLSFLFTKITKPLLFDKPANAEIFPFVVCSTGCIARIW